jgi:hypothetical protein
LWCGINHLHFGPAWPPPSLADYDYKRPADKKETKTAQHQVAEAEKIRNPLNAFGDIMITSGITTEFEKLSHQEKYQAVRDTQIMAQMKEKVIKQHEDPVIILQNARFCSNNSKAVSYLTSENMKTFSIHKIRRLCQQDCKTPVGNTRRKTVRTRQKVHTLQKSLRNSL